jgi:hypothetical protein
MIKARDAADKLMPKDIVPKDILSTYSRVAYVAFGYGGVAVTDLSLVITLLGVCCAYQINFATLISEYKLFGIWQLTATQLTVLSAVLVYPISCRRYLSGLANISTAGLLCVLVNVAVLLGFGLFNFGGALLTRGEAGGVRRLTYGPESPTDLAAYFGVAVFCFGLCSFAYPVEESMLRREEFPQALLYCLAAVCAVYVAVGDGAALLFNLDVAGGGVGGNILLSMPPETMAALAGRSSMAAVCLLTYPLVLMPPAQMLEAALLNTHRLPLGATDEGGCRCRGGWRCVWDWWC